MNKNFSAFAVILTTVFISAFAFAQNRGAEVPERFCVTDQNSYNQYREKLPGYFKDLPVVMGAETKKLFMDVIVLMNIEFKNGTLILKTDIWKFGARYLDEVEISKVCFNTTKKTMNIDFLNQKDLKVEYKDHGFTADGVDIARLSPADRSRLRDRIAAKEAEHGSRSESKPVPASGEAVK